MEDESSRPIGVREDRSCAQPHTGPARREVALEERVAVEGDRYLLRAFSAESRPLGGLLLSQLESAGQSARAEASIGSLRAGNLESLESCGDNKSSSSVAG